MRTGRPDVEYLYSDDHVFNLGGFEHLAEGRDLTICSAGYMVHECNKAIEMLDKKGVSVGLVDLYSLPFDAEGVLDIIGASSGNVMTVEDNFGGALGSSIAEALLESGDGFRLKQMHVTRIPKSARTPEEVLKMCNLTADDIVKNAMELLGV
jgi:transketolase